MSSTSHELKYRCGVVQEGMRLTVSPADALRMVVVCTGVSGMGLGGDVSKSGDVPQMCVFGFIDACE